MALSAAMRKPVYGSPERRLDALVAGQPPEVLDRLLARAALHAGTIMVDKAVADLEGWATDPSPTRSTGPRAERWSVSVEWTEPDGSRRVQRTGAKLFTSEAEAEAWAAAVAAGEVALHEDQGDVAVVDVRAVA